MDLFCHETVERASPNTGSVETIHTQEIRLEQHEDILPQPIVSPDTTISEDKRVLRNLLIKELYYIPSSKFLNPGMSEVTTNIRKILVNWMMDLCEHRDCEIQVFFVAVNLLDRFMSTTRVHRNQLQLAACACLLIASKIRQCSYLCVELLAFYTEDSVTHHEIREWEVLVLAKLSWDTCPITASDFIEPLLNIIPVASRNDLSRKHLLTYLAIALCEIDHISTPPSLVTAGALLVTVQGLNLNVPNVVHTLTSAVNCSVYDLRVVEDTFIKYIHSYESLQNTEQPSSTITTSNSQSDFLGDCPKLKGQITPTDITNVEF